MVTFNPTVGRASRESVTAVFAVGVPSAVATLLFDLDYVVIDKLMVSYHDLALAAIGLDAAHQESALRFSFNFHTTKEELDETYQALAELLPVLRRYRRC